MNDLNVRKARADDAQAMADILNPLIEEGTSTAMEGWQTALDWQALASGETERAVCHVAEDANGQILGFQYIEPSALDPQSVCGIATFARIDGGGRGIGRALFAQTKEAARALGFSEIGATIRADNISGLAYYSKMGFRDDRVFPAVPLANGRPVDRIRKVFKLS